jgi:hypothetical protein
MDDAEQVERLDIIRIDGECPLIADARAIEPAGAVMIDAGGKLRSFFGRVGYGRNGVCLEVMGAIVAMLAAVSAAGIVIVADGANDRMAGAGR